MLKEELTVLTESKAIVEGETLLRTPIEELPPSAQLIAWSVIDALEKTLLVQRKKDLNESLKRLAQEFGVDDEEGKGHRIYQVPGTDGTITKQRREGKDNISVEKLKALLKKKDISPRTVIESKPVVNQKKLDRLIEEGIFTPEEYDSFASPKKPTFALVVEKPSAVKALLTE